MKRVNVALVGFGYWGKKVYRYLNENPNVDLSYVCYPSFSGEKLKLENSPAKLTSSLDEVLNDRKVECVFLATPVNTHFSLSKKSLMAGKNVMVEKPLSESELECEQIASLAYELKKKVITDYTYTFSKSLIAGAHCLSEGKIGPVERIELSIHQLGRFLPYDVFTLLGSHALSILDMFVPLHTIDLVGKPVLWNGSIITAGEITFSAMKNSRRFSGRISLSLHSPIREKKMVIYGANGTITYCPLLKDNLSIVTYDKTQGLQSNELVRSEKIHSFDENDNLKNAVDELVQVMNNKSLHNLNRAVNVTRALDKVKRSAYAK